MERACFDAVRSNAVLLEELKHCEADVDCREVASLVAGHCGTFVNELAFTAQRETVSENLHACDSIPQVVFPCPKLRAACRQNRCEGEPIAEIPEECSEQTAALTTAAAASRACTEDQQCGLFLGVATTNEWLGANVKPRSALSLACGTTLEPLFAIPPPGPRLGEAPFPICNAGRCEVLDGTEKFTTTVSAKSDSLEVTQPDECINSFVRSLHGRLVNLSFRVSIARDGSLNQFEFFEPESLSPAAARLFAYQLHQCRMPVVRGGHPVSVRMTYRMHVR